MGCGRPGGYAQSRARAILGRDRAGRFLLRGPESGRGGVHARQRNREGRCGNRARAPSPARATSGGPFRVFHRDHRTCPPRNRTLRRDSERAILRDTPCGAQGGGVQTMPEQEFLAELNEKTTSVTIREFKPDGVLISYNLQGTVKGEYDANHMESVDAFFKPDGTYEFESRGIDQTDDGDMLIIKAKGTGRQVSPTSVHAEGEAVYQTLSEKLKWLNTAKGRFEGTYNTTTGEFVAKVFALK